MNKFTKGEEILVRNYKNESWLIREFVFMDGKIYVCRHLDYCNAYIGYKQAKKYTKKGGIRI